MFTKQTFNTDFFQHKAQLIAHNTAIIFFNN